MKPRNLILALVAVLALAPAVLPPYYVTLLNYIGLYTLVVLGLVLLEQIYRAATLLTGHPYHRA